MALPVPQACTGLVAIIRRNSIGLPPVLCHLVVYPGHYVCPTGALITEAGHTVVPAG